MPKPIVLMYIPYESFFGNNISCGEMMRILNGDDPKTELNHSYGDYLWFVFVKSSIDAPELKVFHEKDFTEIQQDLLKKMVMDSLQSMQEQPTPTLP